MDDIKREKNLLNGKNCRKRLKNKHIYIHIHKKKEKD